MKKYITEFIGTFFLVLTIGLTVLGGVAMAPLAIGSILMVMIYAGGHISGAHYNPAVTLAVFMRGKCSAADVPIYMVVQIVAAVVAALVVALLIPDAIDAFWKAKGSTDVVFADKVRPLLAEFLGTFALCYVVLNSATSKGTEGNSFYGLAIGFTVMACAWSLGGISGGAFNPAVAVGAITMGLANIVDIWVFLLGQFGAAALAAVIFKMTDSGNSE